MLAQLSSGMGASNDSMYLGRAKDRGHNARRSSSSSVKKFHKKPVLIEIGSFRNERMPEGIRGTEP